MRPALYLFIVSILAGCKFNEEPKLFELVNSSHSGITFTNKIIENDQFNMVDFYYVYNGGGVSLGDINNDGQIDVLFTGNMTEDRLYLNQGNLKFEDITESSGLIQTGWSTGSTMADINGDGLLDIYINKSGNYDSAQRKNQLYVNNGDLTFTESATQYGLDEPGYSTQAAFFDYDKDGDLDLFVANHTNDIRNPNQPKPIIADGSGPGNDRLYRNDDGSFKNVSNESGILFDGMGLGLAIGDLNGDGWEDVYVSNDFIAHDFLYINNTDGTFTESSQKYFKHMSQFGMGNEIADLNNDGLMDAITLDMLPPDNFHRKKMAGPMNANLFEYTLQQGIQPQYMRNTLQLNRGVETSEGGILFEEIGQLSGIDASDWSWCPLVADFDMDSRNDVFITNGYFRDITDLDFVNYTAFLSQRVKPDSLDQIIREKAKEMQSIEVSNFMFKNQGKLRFSNQAYDWGLSEKGISNGAAYADLDNDGDLDLVINNTNEKASIYKNNSSYDELKNYLIVDLQGNLKNTNAIGAVVKIFTGTHHQVKSVQTTRGFQSSIDPSLYFAFPNGNKVDSIIVVWPDQAVSKLFNTKTNQILYVDRKGVVAKTEKEKSSRLFQETTSDLNIDYIHKDMFYNDFSRQFLLPHKYSTQGPGVAISDANGDGLDDFFVGGGYRFSGRLFFQNEDGSFSETPLTIDSLKSEEDLGALFFDYDNDGDQDLYIVSGGNEHFAGSGFYQDRLYENNGSGNFKLDVGALPPIKSSGSCVKAADFDQDGDLDLFVGGRLTPLQYPGADQSYLLINDNGVFSDKTDVKAKGLKTVGMVTDAIWSDFNGDGASDLIVLGEFMSIRFFKNENGFLKDISTKSGINDQIGWWNSLNGGDFDNDGDIDYVAGNLGLNSRYRATSDEPINVYSKDFDGNGYKDAILTSYLKGKEYPTHSRDDLVGQIRSWKSRFNSYADYATSDIEIIIKEEFRDGVTKSTANHFSTSYIENLGNGRFKITAFPVLAQKGPVHGIVVEDLNDDGNLDVILSGNSYATEVVVGRYDGMNTEVFLGNGNGDFKNLDIRYSGLVKTGDNRGVGKIIINQEQQLLFTTNSSTINSFKMNNSQHQFFDASSDVCKIQFVINDGNIVTQEIYYGESYLSQSSRQIKIPKGSVSLTTINYRNESKQINLNDLNTNENN